MTRTPPRSPQKSTKLSPIKKTSSPRKSPRKNLGIFSSDFSAPLNESWADIVAKDEELEQRLTQSCESKRASSRKAAAPKKVTTKPKYLKTLEAVEAPGSSQEEFPPLGTPKSEKQQPRKRHLSRDSTILDEGCSPTKRAVNRTPSSGRPARKLPREEGTPSRVRLFDSFSTTSSPRSVKSDPTKWCTDETTLTRRTREIERAKEKPIYAKYLAMVPKEQRNRDLHPRTPNKLLNYSRRSWDQQIRIWKRKLYAVCGEEPSESCAGSDVGDSEDDRNISFQEDNTENVPVMAKTEIVIRPEADAMASLLGKFDIDTRSGVEESTLKAPTTGEINGPVDFSALHS